MDNKVDKGFEKYFASLLNEEHKSEKFIEIRNKGLYGIKGNLKNAFKAGQEDRDREMEKCKQAAIRHGNMFDEFFNDVGTLLGIEKEVLELGDPQYIYETISKNTAEVEDLKGQTNKALIMTTNYMTENRQLIKQLEKRQHLQSLLDKAVELIKGYYPDTDYPEGVDHEDFIKVKKRLNKQAEQFLKDCKGE